MTDLLRGNPKTLVWSESADAAFCAAKAALAAATALVHPLPGAVISLATDASDTHIGGVLQQLSAGSWKPLAFFSRKLSPPESKYSTFDRELLAVFAAIRHFRFVLEGRPFRILTDHLPLTLAMRRVSPLWSARQVRQLAYVSEFSMNIRYTPWSPERGGRRAEPAVHIVAGSSYGTSGEPDHSSHSNQTPGRLLTTDH